MKGLECISALKALGEENRLRILSLVFEEPLPVTQIASLLKISQYNVSKHLRIMREAGLLEMTKSGNQRLYAVVPELKARIARNKGVLDLDCCTFRLDKLPR